MKRAKRVEAWAVLRTDGSARTVALARTVLVTDPYTVPGDALVRLLEIRPGERIVGPEEAQVLRAARAYARLASDADDSDVVLRMLTAARALKKGKAGR